MAFFEFNIAMSGLFSAQRGLQVTSNNITNAATPGYSRQILSQKAASPLSGLSVGMLGTGVETTGIHRVRNSFIDQKIWHQHASLGEYSTKVTQNMTMETIFGEPKDSGFTAVFNEMFTAMSSLSLNPSSNDNKVIVKEKLASFTNYYNTIYSSLQNQQKDINYEVKSTVNQINNLSGRIKDLNKQIFDAELYGNEASSFRDERDACIDELSQLINVEVIEEEVQVKGQTVNKMTVKAAGQTLVDHVYNHTLELHPRPDDKKLNETDIDDLYDIELSNGMKLDLRGNQVSGKLKGLIDMRDGAGTKGEVTYNGVPFYMSRLNEYVRGFARAMNETYSKTEDGYIQVEACTLPGIGDISHIKKNEDGSIDYYQVDAVTNEKVKRATAREDVDGKMHMYDIHGTEMGLTDAELHKATKGYATRYALFTYSTGDDKGTPVASADFDDYSKLTANNFSISKELLEAPHTLRTTYTYNPLTGEDTNPSDTGFMLELLAQKDNKSMYKEGDPKDYMISIFSELGINAKEASMYQSTQVAVTKNLVNQRLSHSQVETTEEFTTLIKYQQAYQAAAKIMNTIDGIYETTIFKLGNF